MGPTKSVCETHCIVIAEDKRSSQPNLDLVSGTLLTVYQDSRVRERKGGATRKVIVQKEQVELKTIDFSLSLHKSSKLNTCSPFPSLLSQLVFYSI